MDYMTELTAIAKTHGGIIETKIAAQRGISKAMLYKLCKEDKIHRIVKGQYILPDDMQDELLAISNRSERIIFSHERALYLHGISDRTPFEHTVTAPSGCIPSAAIKSECKVYYIKPELFELGKTTLRTPAGNDVPAYDLERSICDVIRSRNKLGTETFLAALKMYAASPKKNLNQLNTYAKRLLVRLSASEYKEKFVLKGGMLVAAIVGLDNRATMDMDTTLKNLPLTPEAIRSALEDVCDIAFDDGVVFEIGTISPIREDDIYGGYRVMLNAKFDTLLTPLSIDVSTGDAITPHAVQYNVSEIFDDEKSYELWAYNIETVMAEKVETILRRGVFNTRPRDFYDTYILTTTQKFDNAVFADALSATAKHRGTTEQIADVPSILYNIEESPELKTMWGKYRKQFSYAKDITYEQIMDSIKTLLKYKAFK